MKISLPNDEQNRRVNPECTEEGMEPTVVDSYNNYHFETGFLNGTGHTSIVRIFMEISIPW